MQKFRANGKLLIAGEYTVLDGGLAFAVPTKLGQTLEIFNSPISNDSPKLFWEANLDDGSNWFTAEFNLPELTLVQYSDEKLALKLQELLNAVSTLNPDFFQKTKENIHCKTHLEFPKDWGLGSSSTLIYLLAKWAGVDEFELSNLTFKTSGYDIACAGNDNPILYQLEFGQPKIHPIKYHPEFLEDLYLVYLNQKQDTQIGVAQSYKSLPKNELLISEMTNLVQKIYQSKTLKEFESNIEFHENALSEFMQKPKVKDLYFSDYEGSVKSLGAWGGDFVLVTKRDNLESYFRSKGYSVLIPWKDLVRL